ncbi:MAG TPA: TRAM domain-containing protein [Actinomycetales bacterium]
MSGGASLVGLEVEVDVGPVAHGGHCVARHEGRVLFVRHTLPGERVVARVTEGAEGDRFLRADAVTVLTAAPGRVARRCAVSGPGQCGGCDWQHASLPVQRELKGDVVREQLHRLAGIDRDVVVEAVPGDHDGLDWRTRVRFAVDEDGRLGLRKHRSHDVVPVATCPIAHPRVDDTGVTAQTWRHTASVEVVVPSADAAPAADAPAQRPLVVVEPTGAQRPPLPPVEGSVAVTDGTGALDRVTGRTWVSEQVVVGGWQRELRVTGSGFWQVHPHAASTLVGAVLDALDPQPGEQALDLYAGVGLFAAALADRLGPQGAVLAIEGDERAVRDARRNLHDLPGVGITAGRVDRVLASLLLTGLDADLVVLDPPRTGAGRTVVQQVCELRPRAIAYVACDPAALARDISFAAGHGYRLSGLRAFDLFPMTQHVECVATLVPSGS